LYFMVSVSVIIPVYNDTRLRLCLAALQRQTYQNFEVIVVDNHSTEDIQSICELFGVRYYSETQPGSYAARNRGIAEAVGEIIALTDADCIPDPNWLFWGIQAVAISPLIGGAIQFCFQGKHPTGVEYIDSLSYLRQQDYVMQEHYAASANLFVHRSVFEAVGRFDQRLINLGDKEFCQRADAAGFRVAYCPNAMVWHPARTTLQALLHKARRQARASVKLAALRGEPAPQANFLPLGWAFWRAVATDPKLPRLSQKLMFVAVIHSLKWVIAYTLFISPQHQNLHPD
jgi:GT2 family glycosyltransferase